MCSRHFQPCHPLVLLPPPARGGVAAAPLPCLGSDPAKGLAQLLEWPTCLGFRVTHRTAGGGGEGAAGVHLSHYGPSPCNFPSLSGRLRPLTTLLSSFGGRGAGGAPFFPSLVFCTLVPPPPRLNPPIPPSRPCCLPTHVLPSCHGL